MRIITVEWFSPVLQTRRDYYKLKQVFLELKHGYYGLNMHHLLLKRCGVLFIIVGLTITAVSLYMSYMFSITILTEIPAAIITICLGVHLIQIGREQTPKLEEYSNSKNGRMSPFYFELEPTLVTPRALPPVPKDIGREYDPIVLDKV